MTALMEGYADSALTEAHPSVPHEREWVQQVISLLESAVAQVHPAQSALREAALLLRLRIGVPAAKQPPASMAYTAPASAMAAFAAPTLSPLFTAVRSAWAAS